MFSQSLQGFSPGSSHSPKTYMFRSSGGFKLSESECCICVSVPCDEVETCPEHILCPTVCALEITPVTLLIMDGWISYRRERMRCRADVATGDSFYGLSHSSSALMMHKKTKQTDVCCSSLTSRGQGDRLKRDFTGRNMSRCGLISVESQLNSEQPQFKFDLQGKEED